MFKSNKAIMILLAVALTLSACLPAAQETESPQVENTQSLIDVQSQINTSVAQTIEAQNQIGTFVAQTIEAQATLTPSATPFTIPTFTPFVISTATVRASGGGGGGGGSGGGSGSGGSGSPQYDCALVNQKPRDGDTIYRPGDSFDVVWTLKNTGTKVLDSTTSLIYIGGTSMSPTAGFMLGYDVDPGDTFSVRIEVDAPAVTGLDKKQFTMQWAVVAKGVKICKPYIAIFVQKR